MEQKNNHLKNLYIMQSIQGFALSMIGIFLPIYLLTLGYSVRNVIVFFIFHYSFLLFFSFFALRIAGKIGLIQTIILRFPFLFTYLAFFYFLKSVDIPLVLIAFFSGLDSALFWMPLHIIFSKNTSSKKIGSETGKLFAIPKAAGIFAPLIGGVIAVKFGFGFLFILAFIILLIAIIPLLKMRLNSEHFNVPDKIKLENGKRIFKKYKKYFFVEIFDNMAEEVGAIIYPIFVFLALDSITSVGYVGTLVKIGAAIFTFMVGRFSDRFSKKKIIKIAAILLIINWSIRYFANSELLIYTFSILAGFFFILLVVPYTSLFYRISHEEKSDDFFVWREIPVNVGRLIILLIALLFVNHLNYLFPIAGLSYIYFLFL